MKCNSCKHYSNTLMVWRDEFISQWDKISKQGFDLTFKRMWNFYLSYCEAGFKSKNIDLIQFFYKINKQMKKLKNCSFLFYGLL